jgi:hypothetical protein
MLSYLNKSGVRAMPPELDRDGHGGAVFGAINIGLKFLSHTHNIPTNHCTSFKIRQI